MTGKKGCNNIIMLTVCIILFISISLFGGMRFVKADKVICYEKSFVTIEIQPGDTLTDIAERYAISEAEYLTYIEEVKNINNLKDDIIHSGCYLLVPIYEVNK